MMDDPVYVGRKETLVKIFHKNKLPKMDKRLAKPYGKWLGPLTYGNCQEMSMDYGPP